MLNSKYAMNTKKIKKNAVQLEEYNLIYPEIIFRIAYIHFFFILTTHTHTAKEKVVYILLYVVQ